MPNLAFGDSPGLAVKIAELEKKYDGKIIDIYKVLDKFNKDESNKIEIGFKCK